MPNFPGQSNFKGTVYHCSQHQDASLSGDVTGKKVVVVGTGNSGHDIAQNFHENGANVTMIQRWGTYVISAKTGLFMLHEGLYDEGGPLTEDADVYGQSLPIPVQFALNVDGTNRIAAAEKDNLDGLKRAGFKVDFGEDGSGIFRKSITRGGDYYIDVGCSQLIIDGKIKLRQSPDGIKEFEPPALVLADGTKLEADIVVLATGYENMVTSARKIFGDKVADRCNDAWDLDDEAEIKTVRNSNSLAPVLDTDKMRDRCGDPAVILISGSWEAVSPCAAFIHALSLCKSRLLRRATARNRKLGRGIAAFLSSSYI